MRTFSHIKTSFAMLATLATAFAATPSQAVVVLDADFSVADGYTDAKLQFQEPNGSGNGVWLGQDGPTVDSSGTGNLVALNDSSIPRNDNFRRNLWNQGATGGTAGGGVAADESGNGFNQGDVIKIDMEYQFNVTGAVNIGLFDTGVRTNFSTAGFDASPTLGFRGYYAEFNQDTGGALKLYSSFDRLGFIGEDNAFALFATGDQIGLDPSGNSTGTIDLSSDRLLFSYSAEYTDASSNTWTATELSITNLDNPSVSLLASVEKPAALEATTYSGSEMYFGSRWLNDASADGTVVNIDGVRFEYIPVPGAAVDGDYNSDGVVDAADYTVWRSQQGQVGGGLSADGTGDDGLGIPDGDVDEFDYNFWRANYGASNSASASAAAVPEPSSVLLILAAMFGLGLRRRS